MINNQARRSSARGKSPGDEYLRTLAERLPQMTRLFEILDSGVTPNFLDIMSAINEMVAFDGICRQDSEAVDLAGEIMSQKKCRFCS